jgi:agmatine deiminase
MDIKQGQIPSGTGFQMPAEWEPHDATWIGWPHKRTDWPRKMAPIPWVYGEIVRKTAPHEIVRLIVNGEADAGRARRLLDRIGVEPSRVELFRIATDRGWTRDVGPMFVAKRDGKKSTVAIVQFGFNGWAKYDDCSQDSQVSSAVSRLLSCETFVPLIDGRQFILEGGSIDVNGSGTLLTTEECLLDVVTQVRNPGYSRVEIEEVLRAYLGVSKILWLGRGIAGDDTHGHVDDLCRFVDRRTVVLADEKNAHDANYEVLCENYERLQSMTVEDGSAIEVVKMPMPAPLYCDGQRVPASYANFYFCNDAVLVPTFNDPNDRVALGILGELFPNREVVGIHAVDLVWGLGTIHCLTQQQPKVQVTD